MDRPQIEKAVSTLRAGGVVIFPTETVYGFAADATNERAVERVMAIKGREGWKTPPLIAADIAMVEKYCLLSPLVHDLVRRFWPGPLSVVIAARGLASGVMRDGTVALRVSSHPTAQALSRELGAPIVATSANVAGQPACYDVTCVKKQFATKPLQPDFYLDEGCLKERLPSTIVKEENGKIVVLRQGEIELPKTYVA